LVQNTEYRAEIPVLLYALSSYKQFLLVIYGYYSLWLTASAAKNIVTGRLSYPIYTIEQTSSRHRTNIEQTSSRPDGTSFPDSKVRLGLARSWSRVM